MAFGMKGAFTQRLQDSRHLGTAANHRTGPELFPLDSGSQMGSQRGMEKEMLMTEDSGTSSSRIELLEAEIEELGSLLDNEKSKTNLLNEELEQSLQELEGLKIEGQRDLSEKEDALIEIERQLLESKDESRQLKEALDQMEEGVELGRYEHLEQQKQWSSQLEEAEQQKQASTAQLLAVQEQFSAQSNRQVEELEAKLEDARRRSLRVEELEKRQEDLETRLQESQDKAAELTSQRADLEAKVEKLGIDLDEKVTAHKKLQAENQSTWEKKLSVERENFQQTEKQLKNRIEEMQPMYARKNEGWIQEMKEKDEAIERLNDQIYDLRIDTSLVPSMSGQLAQLRDDVAKLQRDKNQLEDEKKELRQTVSDLEQVRSVQVCTQGVVISVDFSSSLTLSQAELAKEAFRIVISEIWSRDRSTHVGIVVHRLDVSRVRNIGVIDRSTGNALDSFQKSGTEQYTAALREVDSMFTAFRGRFPRGQCRLILIGDGNTVGGYPTDLVDRFQSQSIRIHNVVVGSGTCSSCHSSQTAAMSRATGGQSFGYLSSSSSLVSDALLGPRR